MRTLLLMVPIWGLPLLFNTKAAADSPAPRQAETTAVRTFTAEGVVQEVKASEDEVVIKHGAISNYMSAMTMPFKVLSAATLSGLEPGDQILFQLHVTDETSWVDHLERTGAKIPVSTRRSEGHDPTISLPQAADNPLLSCKFTNELGQTVTLHDFHGQALAVTFFYTRCPLPNFCPRLSKNFQEASQKLAAMPNAPSNWHFLSITFDPAFDTPAVLKAYGESYGYDPKRWTFLTGPPEQIAELARSCGLQYEPNAGTINHNFRTLIVNASGHLQIVFPTSGDLSDGIVEQMLKAAEATNLPNHPAMSLNQSH